MENNEQTENVEDKKLENVEDKKLENVATEEQTENDGNLAAKEDTNTVDTTEKQTENNDKPLSKKDQIIQFLKFLGFSISAGVIQILSFELLYNWIGWKVWWASYLISIILSVVWNFTFNRKFTFKSASNVPIAMTLVIIYYCVFTPISVFGGDALEGIGWNGTLVTFLMMVVNFLTEYVWDRFIVFNEKITNKILGWFKKNK